MILRIDRLQTELPPPSDPDPVGASAVQAGLPKKPTGVVANNGNGKTNGKGAVKRVKEAVS